VVKIVEGGVLSGEGYESGCYVKPEEERIHLKLYNTKLCSSIVLKYSGTVENALELQTVAQGLSSAIMTNNLRAEHFLSVAGSDCGIANVNIGTWC
jgi:aldehyde dehydrogenase (NAD+)